MAELIDAPELASHFGKASQQSQSQVKDERGEEGMLYLFHPPQTRHGRF
jgi:hypothetical protein